MLFTKIAMLAIAAILADDSGCQSSDDVQNKAQEQTNMQAVQTVGMPSITQFSEKQQLKRIFEMRDEAVATTTYIADLNGGLHKFCSSYGFGIPYATQYTNPERYDWSGHGVVLPQADPNGLYAPTSAEGTWVICLDPKTKHAQPVYVEPRIVVSPFELPNAK